MDHGRQAQSRRDRGSVQIWKRLERLSSPVLPKRSSLKITSPCGLSTTVRLPVTSGSKLMTVTIKLESQLYAAQLKLESQDGRTKIIQGLTGSREATGGADMRDSPPLSWTTTMDGSLSTPSSDSETDIPCSWRQSVDKPKSPLRTLSSQATCLQQGGIKLWYSLPSYEELSSGSIWGREGLPNSLQTTTSSAEHGMHTTGMTPLQQSTHSTRPLRRKLFS